MKCGDFETIIQDFSNGVYDFTDNGKCIQCGNCCSRLLPVTKKEIKEIRRYITKHKIGKQNHGLNVFANPTIDCTCPFLDTSKMGEKCAIYAVRPLICRDFVCSKGKIPDIKFSSGHYGIVDFTEEFFNGQ